MSFFAVRARIAVTTVTDAVPRTTLDDLLREARTGLERLDPAAALEAQADGALLIDTRSHDERSRTGVIPGSLHIPRSVLEWRLDPAADPAFHNRHVEGLDQQIVLVCAHGCSSSLAAGTLRVLGFTRATDLDGGFVAWQAAELPVRRAPHVDPRAVPGMGDPDS
jgi:rhodanese-related sulfurtransferase